MSDQPFPGVADAPPPSAYVSEAEAVPLRFTSVSKVQAKIALRRTPSPSHAGNTLLDDVNAAVAASGDEDVVIAWDDATTVERNGLFVARLAPHIPGLDTDAALDRLFAAAAQIQT